MVIQNSWPKTPFPSVILKNKLGREHQINTSQIRSTGEFPVVDQGQSFIAGFSDDKKKVFTPTQPVIVFGDHTRCFKYVDFPFIMGADGTKIIFPDQKRFNPKFFYYALLALQLPSRGYNRHFKLLKEQQIPEPPLPAQNEIAQMLALFQSAIENQEKIIKTAMELKKSLMQKLFNEGLRNEKKKDTDIGALPQSWKVAALGDAVEFRTGKLNSNQAKRDGKYPFFTCSQETFKIDDYAFDTEAILLSGNNAQAIYSVKYYKGKFNAYQRTYVITIKDVDSFDYFYLRYLLEFYLGRLRQLSIGSSTKYLTLGLLQSLRVSQPPYDEQVKIGEILNVIDAKVEIAKKLCRTKKELFSSLLGKLVGGEVRVNNSMLKDEKALATA